MEKNQEIDLIDLLWQFLQKIAKNKFLFSFLILLSVMIGIGISKYQKEVFHTKVMVETSLKSDIFCNLIQELNIQNQRKHTLTPKIISIVGVSKKSSTSQILFQLNDTSSFNEIKNIVARAITTTPFVQEYISHKKSSLQRMIDALNTEIEKTEKFYHQLIQQPKSVNPLANINYFQTIIDLKINRNEYQDRMDKTCSIKYVDLGSSLFFKEDNSKKIILLSFFIGFFLASLLVLIKKD